VPTETLARLASSTWDHSNQPRVASSKPKYEENRPSWIFITGGSRGIGRAIALKAPADGANVVIAAKTNEPHPKLPETIQTVAREIEAIGGKALPLQLDVRRDDDIRVAVAKAAKAFGGARSTQACLPFLSQASNPHVLVLSPPLDLAPAWFGEHCGYTISKYGMSMCVLGMAEEFRTVGVAVNALWPRTMIDTAASKHFGLSGAGCRTPEIMPMPLM